MADDEMPLTIMNEIERGAVRHGSGSATPGQSKKQTEMLTARVGIIPELDSIPTAKNP